MAVLRVSDLPTVSKYTIEQEKSYDLSSSRLEISMLSTVNRGQSDEMLYWISKGIDFKEFESKILEDSRTIIGSADDQKYGYIKIGHVGDPDNYDFPLLLDSESRAYVKTQKDPELERMKYETWEFVLSAGQNTTRTVQRCMVIADSAYTEK